MGVGRSEPSKHLPEGRVNLRKASQKNNLLVNDHFLSSFAEVPAGHCPAGGQLLVPVGLMWCCSQSLARRGLWQRNRDPCSSASAASCCQQGAGSILTCGCRWERRDLVPPLLMPQASASPAFLLFSGEAAQLVITLRLERLGAERGQDPLCAAAGTGSSRSSPHLHLFLTSLQWEKLSPLGKQQKENVQRRLMSRFSLSGTRALSHIPSSLRA